jgi:hypothetical protein
MKTVDVQIPIAEWLKAQSPAETTAEFEIYDLVRRYIPAAVLQLVRQPLPPHHQKFVTIQISLVE